MYFRKALILAKIFILSCTIISIPSFAKAEKAVEPMPNIALKCHKTFIERPMKDGKFIYPPRFAVQEDKRSWNIPYEGYNPPYYRDKIVENNTAPKGAGWAEPESKINTKKLKAELFREFLATSDNKNIPLNPCGRTGIVGQGLLGKWGENWAADPIITRYDPKTGKLLILLIKRSDNLQWAIPGGMVDPHETKLSHTAARELKEETGLDISMDKAVAIYEGLVDDSRNTDNSWMMTKVYHLHLNNKLSRRIETKKLEAADATEIKKIEWVAYDDQRLQNLFASHSHFIELVIKSIKNKE